MNMKDLIKEAEKYEKNSFGVCYSIKEKLGFWSVDIPDEQEERFTAIMPIKWCCTDSYVGLTFYYFDNEFICYSWQEGRKCDKNFYWASKEAYEKVYNFIKSFELNENIEYLRFVFFEEEINDYYYVEFYNQLLSEFGVYNGRNVAIIEDGDKGNCISEKAMIQYIASGEQEIVDVREIQLKYFE